MTAHCSTCKHGHVAMSAEPCDRCENGNRWQPRQKATLIAFCSPAMGSGKSTAADHLCEQHGFTKVSFATPLKGMAASLLRSMGMSEQEVTDRVYGHRKEEEIAVLGMTSRRLQQLIGTEFGRDMIDQNVWVNITMAFVDSFRSRGIPVVIDDMRFPNEYTAVLAADGICRRIVRPGAQVSGGAHASEGKLDLVAMPEIWNSGSVEELHRVVDRLVVPA